MIVLLQVTRLSKRFGGLQAVQDVSFTVGAGEIVGLIGPNGAGKSTVFNLINGVSQPDLGQVVFDGKDITGVPPYRVARAGLPHRPRLVQPLLGLSVLDNCIVGACFGRENLGLAQARAVAREVADAVGLGDRLELPANALTTAGKKRLELARALSARPRLLLLETNCSPASTRPRPKGTIETVRRAAPGVIDDRAHHARDHEPVRPHHRAQSRAKLSEGSPQQVANDPAVITAYLGDFEADCGSGATAMSEKLLEVEALEAGYDDVQVLWGISLTVERGTMTTLLGANGAGKTTSLRAITGSIRPRAGRVLFGGEDVTHLSAHAKAARGLVLVPEGRQLFADMSVGGEPGNGRLFGARPQGVRQPDQAGVFALPAAQGAPAAAGRNVFRRRAADVGDRARPDVGAGNPDHRRALARPRASRGAAAHPHLESAEGDGHHHSAGRADTRIPLGRLPLSDYAYVIAEGRPFCDGQSAKVAAMPEIRRAYLGL